MLAVVEVTNLERSDEKQQELGTWKIIRVNIINNYGDLSSCFLLSFIIEISLECIFIVKIITDLFLLEKLLVMPFFIVKIISNAFL